MSVRSRNLWHGILAGTPGDVTPLNDPYPGYFVVVKSIRVVNIDTEPHPLFMALDAGAALEPLFAGAVMLGRETWIDESWHVLPDGAVVVAWSDEDDVLITHGSGAILGGPTL